MLRGQLGKLGTQSGNIGQKAGVDLVESLALALGLRAWVTRHESSSTIAPKATKASEELELALPLPSEESCYGVISNCPGPVAVGEEAAKGEGSCADH